MKALKKLHHASFCPQASIKTIPENNLSPYYPKISAFVVHAYFHLHKCLCPVITFCSAVHWCDARQSQLHFIDWQWAIDLSFPLLIILIVKDYRLSDSTA